MDHFPTMHPSADPSSLIDQILYRTSIELCEKRIFYTGMCGTSDHYSIIPETTGHMTNEAWQTNTNKLYRCVVAEYFIYLVLPACAGAGQRVRRRSLRLCSTRLTLKCINTYYSH
jgi:hypothetical protein